MIFGRTKPINARKTKVTSYLNGVAGYGDQPAGEDGAKRGLRTLVVGPRTSMFRYAFPTAAIVRFDCQRSSFGGSSLFSWCLLLGIGPAGLVGEKAVCNEPPSRADLGAAIATTHKLECQAG